jgi:hypothetical protein
MRPREELGPELEAPTLARLAPRVGRGTVARVASNVMLVVLVVEGLHMLGLT